MIEGNQFINGVKKYYKFLDAEFNLSIVREKINGYGYYELRYADEKKVISINYENTEDYLKITIFLLENGKMPDYDDKTRTWQLTELNNIFLTNIDKNEIARNNEYFSQFTSTNILENRLLRSAKTLRLCLQSVRSTSGTWW